MTHIYIVYEKPKNSPSLVQVEWIKGTNKSKVRGYFTFNKQAAVFYRV